MLKPMNKSTKNPWNSIANGHNGVVGAYPWVHLDPWNTPMIPLCQFSSGVSWDSSNRYTTKIPNGVSWSNMHGILWGFIVADMESHGSP